MSEHTNNLYNIDEGDDVIITIDGTVTVEATCTNYRCQNARDPEIVREENNWQFESDDGDLVAGITEGLRHREDMKPFPHFLPLYRYDDEETLGYITEVEFK